MIHSLVEVLLLPQLISLIWFSYCLTAAPQRYAFLRLKIHAFCTSAYVIIHTLHTHTVHQTHAMNISPWFILFTTILSNTTPLLFFLPLSIYLPIPPLPHPVVFSQNGNPEAEELLYSHYVICNDTHETLRFGQVDTDENVLLASLHSHQYSWRSHKSPQVTHAHFSYPEALKYVMAQSPVVLVPALSNYAYVHLQKCVRRLQRAAAICVSVSAPRQFHDSIVKEDWLYLTLCGFKGECRAGWRCVACVGVCLVHTCFKTPMCFMASVRKSSLRKDIAIIAQTNSVSQVLLIIVHG